MEAIKNDFAGHFNRVKLEPEIEAAIRDRLAAVQQNILVSEREHSALIAKMEAQLQETASTEQSLEGRLRLQRYDLLKRHEIRIEKLFHQNKIYVQHLAVLEAKSDQLWVKLIGGLVDPDDLILPHEEINAKLLEIRQAQTALTDDIRKIKSDLIAFKADTDTPTGPKTRRLYTSLTQRSDAIAIDATASIQRSMLLQEKGKLFLQALIASQTSLGSAVTRSVTAIESGRQMVAAFMKRPLLRFGKISLSTGDIAKIVVLLILGALMHRFYGVLRKIVLAMRGWHRDFIARRRVRSPHTVMGGWHRLSLSWVNLKRRLNFRLWFPHVPLGAAVGAIGVTLLWQVYANIFTLFQNIDNLQRIPRSVLFTAAGRLGETAGGIMLLLMAVGLIRRSRFAWFITLLISGAMVVAAYIRPYSPIFLWVSLTLFVLLLVFRRYFTQVSVTASSLFALSSVLLFLVYGVFGSFVLGQEFNPPINDFASSLYFTIVTMSTVGYGEITPQTIGARLFVVSLIIMGITVFTASITTVVAPLVGNRLRRIMEDKGDAMERQDHVILTGNSSLAYNTYSELTKRNIPITVIASSEAEQMEFVDFEEPDLVVGDAASVRVLRTAGVDKAQAVMALGEDDSENAFIVLAVKEAECDAKTVCAVNEAKNINRVRRVRPDILIAPQILGGELLAMAVAGEKPDAESLIQRLFDSGEHRDGAECSEG